MDKVYIVWWVGVPYEPLLDKVCKTYEIAEKYVEKRVKELGCFTSDFSIVEEELYE